MWASHKHIFLFVASAVTKIMTWCVLTNTIPAGEVRRMPGENFTILRRILMMIQKSKFEK